MTEKKPFIILAGPTAVGKTELSIKLAERIGGEIISADSMQVYKYMDIGSAKIKKEEMRGVPHHMIDVLEPDEEFHVVRFQEMVKEAMKEIYSRGHIPILTGGTGFYIQAVLYDIDFTEEETDMLYRAELERTAAEKGGEYLHQKLAAVDEKAAKSIHPNNVKRVIRALEFYKLTGTKISEHNDEQKRKQSPYRFAYFVLNDKRERLYERINSRVDKMMADGLLEEVTALKNMGYDRSLVSMQGLGYKELLAYLEAETTLEEAVEIIKRDTRHFAKRQITWFKREPDVIWIDKEQLQYEEERILEKMITDIEKIR